VKAQVAGETRILLQPGDIHDVPGLLVLAYDANGTPIAETVVRNADGSWLHLPSTTTEEIQITLEPATYVTPMAVPTTTGTRITRWSQSGAAGDLKGGCIAVLGADGNSFFDTKDDLDCDNKDPECDDHVYDFVDTPSNPMVPTACASQDFKMPDTGDACRIGQTIACTDGFGTCGPLSGGSGSTMPPPICVPEAVCKSCPNSDSTSGTSGLDMSCEADALMNGDDVPYVDCDIEAMVSTVNMEPCMDSLPPLDFSNVAGAGWGCVHIAGFIGQFGQANGAAGPLPVGADPMTGYMLSASCDQSMNAPRVNFTLTANSGTPTPIPADTKADAMLLLGVRSSSTTTAFSELAVPFHLHFHQVMQCMQNTTASCTLKTLRSGDYKNDPMWKGCAGAM
jgi:hypothetical protein